MTESAGGGAPAAAGVATGATARRRWLRWGAAIVAALVLVGGGTAAALAVRARYDVPTAELFDGGGAGALTSPTPTPTPTVEPGAGITGPLNFLIVGIDPRVSVPNWRPNADAVLILHVTATLDEAYLFSLPRDLVVDIPAFRKARFGGTRTKLTHAMSYGSKVPGTDKPNVAQGFQLLATTVSAYTGITRFDAGAVLNFGGFTKLVDAVGGVDMFVDMQVTSRHREPDGDHRRAGRGGYIGPQMVYPKGMHHFTGWQALDYGRQRYLTGGDYTRQRHQQQLIKALVGKILDQDMARDPAKLDAVLRAVGDTLTFDGRGRGVIDFAYALREIAPADITLVGLPGAGVGRGSGYRGEQLKAAGKQFLTAVREDRVAQFLAANPTLVNKER